MSTMRGFGVAGSLPLDLIRVIVRDAEAAGYTTLWVNDVPRGDGLAALAVAAAVTSRISLAVGVIALDRRPASSIIADLSRLNLPNDRLVLGVGAGSSPGGLDRVRAGVNAIKAETSSRVVVGALGPRMVDLAATVADGVLLNWLTPDWARQSARAAGHASARAGRPAPFVAGYVRTALGAAAQTRLADEAARYERFPSYAAHFGRMGVSAFDTAVVGSSTEEIRTRLDQYAEFDELVVRAITADETRGSYMALMEAARAASRPAAATAPDDSDNSG